MRTSLVRRATTVSLPLRGNPNAARFEARARLWTERSSYHALHVEARFADGSVRSSLPMTLFYLSPRKPDYQPGYPTGACFVNGDY